MTSAASVINAFAGSHFLLLAACVFALGVFLRARRLSLKGLFLWDEAAYFREVLAVRGLASFYRARWRALIGAKLRGDKAAREKLAAEYVRDFKRFEYVWYKVWHAALTYLSCGLVRRADFAMSLPAFIMGCAGILVAMWTGCAVAGPAAGIFSGLCLAVGGMHTLHSRSAEPEIGASLCVQLALAFIIAGNAAGGGAAHMLAAGFFLCGVAMFNPAWFVIVLPLGAVAELVYVVRGGAPPVAAGVSFGAVAAGVVATLLLVNVPFFINGWLLPESGIKSTLHRLTQWADSFATVVGLKDPRVGGDGKKGDKTKGEFCGVRLTSWHRYSFYAALLMKTEGPAAVLAAAGAVLMLARGGAVCAVAAAAVFLFAVVTLSPLKSSRAVVILAPQAAVCAGVCMAALPLPAAAAACLAVLVYGIARGLEISSLTSGVRKAAEFILGSGGENYLCSSGPFSIVYGKDRSKYVVPKNYKAVFMYYNLYGVRHVIVEHHENYPSLYHDDTMRLITEHCKPVFTAPDPCVTYYPLLAEAEFINSSWRGIGAEDSFGSYDDIARWNRFRMTPSAEDRTVRVYSLEEAFNSTKLKELFFDRHLQLITELANEDEDLWVCLKHLGDLDAIRPNHPGVMYSTAGCLFKLEKYETAEKFFLGAARSGDFDDDKKKWSRAHAFTCAIRLGKPGLFESGRTREIEKLIEDELFAGDYCEAMKLQIFIGRANEMCAQSRYGEVLDISGARLAAYPGCADGRFFRAIGMAGMGDREQAALEMCALLDEGVLPEWHIETARALSGRPPEAG